MREGPFKIAAEHTSSGSDQRMTAPKTAARALWGFPRALYPIRSHSAFHQEPCTATCHQPLVPPGTSGFRYSHKYGPWITASGRHSANAVTEEGLPGLGTCRSPRTSPEDGAWHLPSRRRSSPAAAGSLRPPRSLWAAAAQGEFLPCNQAAPVLAATRAQPPCGDVDDTPCMGLTHGYTFCSLTFFKRYPE